MIRLIIISLAALGLGVVLYIPIRKIVFLLTNKLKTEESTIRMKETLAEDSLDSLSQEAQKIKTDITNKEL